MLKFRERIVSSTAIQKRDYKQQEEHQRLQLRNRLFSKEFVE